MFCGPLVTEAPRVGDSVALLLTSTSYPAAGNMLVVPPQRAATGGRAATSSGGGSALARLAETRSGLRPIDHGFCLPEALEPPYLEWLHWPQVMLKTTTLLQCQHRTSCTHQIILRDSL
jgi:hypothetical protein